MKHTLLVRLSGLAAMVSGVLYAALGLAVWLAEPPFPRIIQLLDRGRIIADVINISFVFLVVGPLAAIAALHTLHREFYGMTETLDSPVAFVGVALILVRGLGTVLRLLWTFTPFVGGLMLAALGGMGLGVVTIAARALPWWCAVALIVGSLGFAPAGLFGELWGVLVGVAWAVVGFAIFRAAGRQTERSSRVR